MFTDFAPTSLQKRLGTEIVRRVVLVITLAIATVTFTGCASFATSNAPADADTVELDEGDPFENFNRVVYGFNEKIDKVALTPLAKGFGKLPTPVKTGVSNFFANLFEPTTIVNDLLQAKFGQAIQDTTRFIINTTVGIGGLFDIAQHVDMPRNDEDFGQTLATWGVPDGPYLVLPILGPSSVRHSVGRVPYFFGTDPLFYVDSSGTRFGARALEVVDTRYKFLRTDRLLKLQLDPYLFVRESYWQRRENLIEQ